MDAELGAHFLLHGDVNAGGGILTDANEHEGRLRAARLEGGDALGRFRVNLTGNGAAINDLAEWHQGMRSTVWTCKTGVRGQRVSMTSVPVTVMRVPIYILKFWLACGWR